MCGIVQYTSFGDGTGDLMLLRIDSTSAVPVYAQIVEQVKRAIASGVVVKGEMLPSRRELAIELEINPLTVLKAYKELAGEGLIEIKQGVGCFVAASPEPGVDKYRIQTLTRATDQLISDAQSFGIPLADLEQLVHERVETAEMEEAKRDAGLKSA